MMRLVSSGILLISLCGAAHADIIFTLGNHPQTGETNILFSSGGAGTLVTGDLNGVPGVVADFISSQSLMEPASGQARVSADPEGTALTNVAVSLEDSSTYGDLIVNLFLGGSCTLCTGGASSIVVDALASDGTPEAPFIFTGLNVGKGNNFLTITASDGESIVRTSIDVPGGFTDLRQPRMFDATDPPFTVPEPGTLTLLAISLGAVRLARHLRKPLKTKAC